MTCKDCICSEVCYYKSFNDVRNLEKRRNDVEKICKSFVHRDILKNAPTVEAVEVVHSEWEKFRHPSGTHGIRCKNCKEQNGMKKPYCPNCGAKMDGGKDNERKAD